MLSMLAFAAALFVSPQAQDGPVVTGGSSVAGESATELRLREALAYSNPLPRGAPAEDYALVAWCDALVSGHVKLGETLKTADSLDRDLIRLGRLEAQDFRAALADSAPRQSATARAAATQAAAAATTLWTPILAQDDEAVRSQSFGLFFGLPGRCEHAARRIRDNVSTPPATLAEVGLRSEGSDPAQ